MNRYKTTFETWNKIASLYQDNFMDLNLYNDTYDTFCSAIKKQNASIFEIGCGPGNITMYLLAKRPDFIIEATDVSPNMIELAKKNAPAANFSLMDAREIHTIIKKFDGIMCGFCMPYLSKEDCAKLIQDCSRLLNSKGILYCSVIEGDYNNSGYESGSSGDKAYVYYHQQEYLQQLLTENDFQNIQTFRKQYQKKDGASQTHLVFIAEKKFS
ncbi:MAG: class I SAM-dependent methyltransferase [Bacteroidota bacterium]